MSRTAITRRALRGAAATATAAIAFTGLSALPAVADEQHRVSSGDTVSGLAVRYGASVSSIIDANGLNSRALIVIGQTLTIPSGGTSTAAATTTASAGTHKVASGDTVWGLARKYGTTVSALISANSLNSSATIRIGQTLTIPGAGSGSTSSSAKTSTTTATSTSTSGTLTHKVASGDTVWGLARKYGTSVSAIKDANGLNASATIRIGQSLSIPGGAEVGSSTATTVSNTVSSDTSPTLATGDNLSNFSGETVTYTVVAGDTLGAIAARHGVSVSQIVSNNGIKNAALIKVGQKLTISGGTASGLVGDSFAGRTYDAPTVGAANQNKATLNAMDVPSRDEMQAMVVAAANKYGVDPSLAQAISYQESGFNMRAVSPANAIGAMQVIPTSGEWASNMVGRDLNLLIPTDNVEAGVAIINHLTRNGQDLEIAIAGYYQGEAGVRKYGMYPDTKRYVASVLSLMERF
ncbi:LysM peptidoglycan-binding domain-containing protein [Demequina flava]|uniref:LysM peptidoglycan-binding domain-containing protein n=1 Tax=Demequina flava TaxID=1095025 RepID=UPI001F317EB2|nr:LysM peptidoglycan-binding domain-containing protein [Demequina flava]